MKKEEMEQLTNGIQEKLGKEASALIADDLGKLITDNTLMNSEITKRDEKITKLQTDKENLIMTNGNLLQQVAMGKDDDNKIYNKNQKEEKEEKPFDYSKIFDENRKFYIKSIDKNKCLL